MNEMIPQHDPRHAQHQQNSQPEYNLAEAQPRPPYQAIKQDPAQYPRPHSHKASTGMTLQEEMQMAEMIAGSSMVPKDYIRKPENVWVAMKMGKELGLDPLQAVQNIAVINGRPAVWGDSLLAICRASSVCEYIREHWDAQNNTAICIAKRKDDPAEVQRSFSYEDAKRARLMGKQGPWSQYPQRMCQMRARSWALRDAFADALRGIRMVEEDQDIPEKVVQAEPAVNTLNTVLESPARPEPAPVMDENKAQNLLIDMTTVISEAKTREELLQIGEDLKGNLDNVPGNVRAQLQQAYRQKLQSLTAPQ